MKLTYKIQLTLLMVLVSIIGYGQTATMPTLPVYRLAQVNGLTYAMVMDYTGNAAYTNLTANAGSLQVMILANDGSSVSSVTSRNAGTWSNTQIFDHTAVTQACTDNSTTQYDLYRFETTTNVEFGPRTTVTAYTDTLFYVTMTVSVTGGIIKACGGSASAASPDNCIGLIENNTASFDPDGAGGSGTYGGLNVEGVGTPLQLPVDLIAFTAEPLGNKDALLQWTTASEINNNRFDIERSYDGRTFEVVGDVAGNGNSQHQIDYTYTDASVSKVQKTVYYRLKQVDFDGAFEYSDIRVVRFDALGNVQLVAYPNPLNDELNVMVGLSNGESYQLEVTNLQGKLVHQENHTYDNGIHKLNTSEWNSGMYIVRVATKHATKHMKVVKK